MPVAAYVLAWSGRDETLPSHARAVLLVSSYERRYWASEPLILVYKFVLTGVIHLLPGARLQLWAGVVANLAAWAWLIVCMPFRSILCNAVAATALLQLLLTYISGFLFEGLGALGVDGASAIVNSYDYLHGWAGMLLIALNCVVFVVIAVSTSIGIIRAQQRRSRTAASLADQPSHQPSPIKQRDVSYHLFLSHTWSQGEQDTRTIKLELLKMLPDAKVFLDKDDLRPDLARYLRRSAWSRLPTSLLSEPSVCTRAAVRGAARPTAHRRPRVRPRSAACAATRSKQSSPANLFRLTAGRTRRRIKHGQRVGAWRRNSSRWGTTQSRRVHKLLRALPTSQLSGTACPE